MLPQPACRRAVQRQLLSPTDSIWISDQAVQQAFQQFARGSKVGRRYGSFVPGPMESRRRLGKRRMTLQSDASSIPAFDPGMFRGWFGEKDRTQWQWEAPTARLPNTEAVEKALPSWLLEWTKPAQEDKTVPVVTTHARDRRKKLSFRAEEVAAFCLELETCLGDSSIIVDTFIRRIRQSLNLGVLPEETLKYVLKAAPEAIMDHANSRTEAHSLCLQLYQAMWIGVESCTVIRSDALHGKTLNRLLRLICDLPMNVASQDLGSSVICAASSTQLVHLKDGIDRFVANWIRAMLHDGRTKAYEYSVLDFATSKSSGNTQEEKAVHPKEYTIISTATPITNLGKLLSYLPDSMVCSVLRSTAHYIVNNNFGGAEKTSEILQLQFLALVAQIPAIGDQKFESILKRTTCSIEPSFFSGLVLDQWASQGYLKNASAVRGTFEMMVASTGHRDIATLLCAVDKHKDMCWTRLRRLVLLFDNLGKQRTIYQTAVRMHNAHVKLPADIMGPIIESVSKFDAQLALDLYYLYYSNQLNFAPLRLELCPKFVTAVVEDPRIKPETIWKMMGIPLYETMARQKRFAFSNKKLSPATIKMITNMAITFAHSKRLPRVAFRHVEQCVHHLRRHGAPITPALTSAITKSGIVSKIREGKWVPKERMAWTLDLVERAEGTRAAGTAADVVEHWNGKIAVQQSENRRRINPLGVGHIN